MRVIKYHMLLITGGIILRKLKYNYSISCPFTSNLIIKLTKRNMSACIITLLEYVLLLSIY